MFNNKQNNENMLPVLYINSRLCTFSNAFVNKNITTTTTNYNNNINNVNNNKIWY